MGTMTDEVEDEEVLRIAMSLSSIEWDVLRWPGAFIDDIDRSAVENGLVEPVGHLNVCRRTPLGERVLQWHSLFYTIGNGSTL